MARLEIRLDFRIARFRFGSLATTVSNNMETTSTIPSDKAMTNVFSKASAIAIGRAVLKYGLALALLIGPPIYLSKHPEAYTPLLQSLFSAFLFVLAFWIGRDKEVYDARQQANDRWLPQAEAVTYRLMTLFANVRGFSRTMQSSCGCASRDFPELQQEGLRAVRTKMKMECDASAQRLDDIANQLEDAIGDWQRFIAGNCRGQECARIFTALEERWRRITQQELALAAKLNETKDAPNPAPARPATAP